MITPSQCRMARVGLGWGVRDLARAAQVGVATVNRFETGQVKPTKANLAAIQAALETAGVEFKPDGSVRLREQPAEAQAS